MTFKNPLGSIPGQLCLNVCRSGECPELPPGEALHQGARPCLPDYDVRHVNTALTVAPARAFSAN